MYRFYDAANELIYVGITNNPPKRWQLHAYEKSWWKDVVTREVEWYPTREEAEVVESQVIDYQRPKWNTDGGEPERGRPGSGSSWKRHAGWEPDEAILGIVRDYEQKQVDLGVARDDLETAIVEVMRQGVSAARISKFLPFSTPMIQSIGKKAGVPLLRKPTVRGMTPEEKAQLAS
ncbi:GIY-YIG nuclease family protein [Streptomyces hydrogenans]